MSRVGGRGSLTHALVCAAHERADLPFKRTERELSALEQSAGGARHNVCYANGLARSVRAPSELVNDCAHFA